MPSRKKPVALYEIRITLLHLKPAIWRRVGVPKDITLGGLHDVIQVAMGWEDAHMHEFNINKKRYGPEMPNPFDPADSTIDEDTVRLSDIAKPKAKFLYWYDFGDDWMHELEIERETESDTGKRNARCLAGELACPPDDCGGPPGYAEMLAVLSDPSHENRDELLEWMGEDFDPAQFDLQAVDKQLARFKL